MHSTLSTMLSCSITLSTGLVYLVWPQTGSNHIMLLSHSLSSAILHWVPLACNVPQGSVVDPLHFCLYTTPLRVLLSERGLHPIDSLNMQVCPLPHLWYPFSALMCLAKTLVSSLINSCTSLLTGILKAKLRVQNADLALYWVLIHTCTT